MPNPNNVEPYGKLVHEAKENGGPEEYKTYLKREEYEKGEIDGEKNGREELLKEEGIGLILGFIIAGLVTLGQKYGPKAKKYLIEQKEKTLAKWQEEVLAERNALHTKTADECQSEGETEEVLPEKTESSVVEEDENKTKKDSDRETA